MEVAEIVSATAYLRYLVAGRACHSPRLKREATQPRWTFSTALDAGGVMEQWKPSNLWVVAVCRFRLLKMPSSDGNMHRLALNRRN